MVITIYDGMLTNGSTSPTVQVTGDEVDSPEDVARAYLEVKAKLKEVKDANN